MLNVKPPLKLYKNSFRGLSIFYGNSYYLGVNFQKRLKKFIFSKVKDQTITDDILQEVFIKIHLQKETLQKKDRLKSWLFTITNNTINDYFRKHKKELIPKKEPSNTPEK